MLLIYIIIQRPGRAARPQFCLAPPTSPNPAPGPRPRPPPGLVSGSHGHNNDTNRGSFDSSEDQVNEGVLRDGIRMSMSGGSAPLDTTSK